jgi:hypothetical protein
MSEDNKPKKGLAAMLIANAPRPEMEDDEDVDGQDVAIEDMLAALDQRDVEAFKEALNSFLDMR